MIRLRRLHRSTLFRTLVATVLIFLFTNLFVVVVSRISILDSLGKSIRDFDFTDLYFARRTSVGSQTYETRVVLVNIGNLDRQEIARLVDAIAAYQPRVIGLDIIFTGQTDSATDATLAASLKKAGNSVFAASLMSEDGFPPFDSASFSDSIFLNGRSGFANVDIPESDKTYGTARAFQTRYNNDRVNLLPFGYEVVRMYDSTVLDSYPKWTARQFINFSGGATKTWTGEGIDGAAFTAIDQADVFAGNFNAAFFRGQIVLLGFMGAPNNPAYKDQYYTPMNERYAGRSLPDMFGVEVHANIIRMILDKRYIWNSTLLDNGLSVVILFLCVLACDRILHRYPNQFQLISTVTAFVIVNILIFVPLLIFIALEVKIDLRESILYLLFVPTFFEIIEVNLFRHWRMSQNEISTPAGVEENEPISMDAD